jgi:hypothetical protein
MEECDDGSRHGTAVAEAVVDVAPGATIYLGVPFSSLDMMDIVQWMISEGVTIINHSAGWWWDGPGDGSSPFADSPLAAVDLAVAAGVTWVNASGNNALSNWYGAYSDTNGNQLHEFSPGLDANGLVASENNVITVEVRWDGSWNGASSDLDLFVTDSAGNVVDASIDPQQGQPGQAPFELVQFLAPESDSYQIVVSHVGGAQPAWLQVQAFSQQPLVISNATSSVTSPAESANPGMLAVGAAPWSNPATIENFSGQGPTVDGRIKPEIVGIDKGASATYGAGGFLGTSQASPHVAGMAALVKQRFPSYTPIQVADYLKQNATPVGGQPNNIWGWGLAHLPAVTGVEPIDGAAFDAVWAVTDAEVLAGGASYSWFWGPMEHDERWEPYAESPGGQRAVRYYDKSRMEISNPAGDPNSIWYVTNGLLTTELVTGRVQLGNGTHEQHEPSEQLVAGDPTNNPGTPSYATFGQYVTPDGVTNRAPDLTGQAVTGFLTGDGQFLNIENMGYTYASYQSVTGHNIPDVFYDWMTDPTNGFRPSEGVDWLYVLGYPISEPYWIHATIGGNEQRILVQLYERRVLTYTPSNPPQYQVEFGNIGQHYHRWRYVE